MSVGAGLEEVGEHDVGVELWVEVPRGGMGEGARGEALAADALGAASGEAALGFEVLEAGAHGAVDGGGDLGTCWGVGPGPQDRDRLGR